jgi:hypothetical protein
VSDALTSFVFDDFADDLLREVAPRPLILIGTSKIDDLLLQTLSQYLLPKRKKPNEQDELLEGDHPLATLSARIKLAYRLGIIDETLYRALEQLRALRNLSAHSVAFSIAESPARDFLAELRKRLMPRQSFNLTRERYFDGEHLTGIKELQCLLLSLCVLVEAIRRNISLTNGNKHTLGISRR